MLVKLLKSNLHCLTRWEREVAEGNLSSYRIKAIASGLKNKIDIFREALGNLDHEEGRDDAEDFVDKLETLLAQLEECAPELPEQKSTRQSSLRLPKLDLEPFYGDIYGFDQFWSLFSTCVDSNGDLSAAEKLSYLVSLLKGDAQTVVTGMLITPKNYELAKAQLISRYGHKKKLTHSLFRRLLGIDSCTADSAGLRVFLDNLVTCVRSLENQEVDIDTHSDLLCSHILVKLPPNIKSKCIAAFGDRQWLVSTLVRTLQQHVHQEEACDFGEDSRSYEHFSQASSSRPTTFSSLSAASETRPVENQYSRASTTTCIFCDRGKHLSKECKKFTTFASRFGIVKRNHLCLLCFGNHSRKDCTSTLKCEHCKGDHNFALCKKFLTPKHEDNTDVKPVTTTTVNFQRPGTIILQQIRGTICDLKDESRCYANILFDTGSHLSYIRQGVAEKLGLTTTGTVNLQIATFMADRSENSLRSRVSLNLCGDKKSFGISAIVVPRICPLSPVHVKIPLELENLDFSKFADSCNGTEVDILIGMDLYWSLVTNEVIKTEEGYFAVKTVLGWTLSGCPSNASVNPDLTTSMLISGTEKDSILEETVHQMFSHDFAFLGGSLCDNEEASFLENIRFDKDKERYVASLPWKGSAADSLPDHKHLSQKRLTSLQKKLITNPNTLKAYHAQIIEQLSEGIIEEVNEENHVSTLKHYMPHHCVIRSESSTTQLRVVFDGAAKMRKRELSLNDCLNVGPKLIPLILPLLVKFRCHEIGFVADISKAFLMIEVAAVDRDHLRFLWYRNPFEPSEGIVCYRFKRLPFGLVCSPAVLNAVLKHHLESHGNSSHSDFYVDDFVTGCESPVKGHEKFSNVAGILSKAGFRLHKFASNSSELNETFSQGKDVSVVKVLGLKWITHTDQLLINITKITISHSSMTKRSLLALLGHIFDPLGLLSPITLGIRLVFQTTWQLKLAWDTELPEDLFRTIKNLASTLLYQSNLAIPRFLCNENETSVEIAGFCDASAKAISCVLYMIVSVDDHRSVAFVCGKSRVRPISKSFTIPRLELLSCLLLTNLYTSLKDSFPCHQRIFFSDSVCALSWIKNQSQTWKQFVQSRVNVIRAAINPDSWYHVPGENNAADVGTRGLCDEASFHLWINGPEFLITGTFPKQPDHFINESDHEEVVVNVALDSSTCTDPLPNLDISRFSSYRRLLYTICRVLSLVRRASRFQDMSADAELFICRSVQYRYLWPEVNSNKQIFKQLQVFIEAGIIYVDTRVPNSVTAGVPRILLPYKCDFTVLIIRYCHEQVMHAGLAVTLSKVRETFWILKGRQAVKSVISKCVFCRRVRGKFFKYPDPPKLPDFRVCGNPFGTVGVDYAGPFKTFPGSYILLFTCSVTRAIHLELTPDLTTQQFILALQRFVARRGAPTTFISDNAKTFESASMKLEAIRSSTSTCSFLVDNKVHWLFNCSRASWWGGWFERMIGLVKDILRKTLPKRKYFTFIEFNTFVCNVERVINSRPLSYLSSSDTYEPITPAHLIGTKTCFDLNKFDVIDLYLKRHELTERIWVIFLRDYLGALNERSTQRGSPGDEPHVGDICLMYEPGIKLWHWPLIKIEELLPSKDGQLRKALVRTTKKTLVQRALKHLVPLEAKH